MWTIGVDPARAELVALALGPDGQQERLVLANGPQGWKQLQRWGQQWPQRQWGLEGSGSLAAGLAATLLGAGETVFEVSARLTAWGRRRARQRGKSDALDALAIARVTRDEAAGLPRLVLQPLAALEIKLVSHQRDSLVRRLTDVRSQADALLVSVAPDHQAALRGRGQSGLSHLLKLPLPRSSAVVRRLLRQLVHEYARLAKQRAALEAELKRLVEQHYAPLLAIRGVGFLTAAGIVAELGHQRPGLRESQLAMLAGIAPLEASSGTVTRHRLNRSGNRRLNRWFHVIALTQARIHPPAQAYLAKRSAMGNTPAEARRALKRMLVRPVFAQWMACQQLGA